MSVDLAELVPYVKNKVNGPGGTFVNASNDEWKMSLANGFWSAKQRGQYFPSFREEEGEIFNIAGGPDLSRDLQQVIILFAHYEIVFAKLLATPTKKKASAAPGTFQETERSPVVLKELLLAIKAEIAAVQAEILGSSFRTEVGVIDAVAARERQLSSGVGSIVL